MRILLGFLAAVALAVGLLPALAAPEAGAAEEFGLSVSSPRVVEGNDGRTQIAFVVSGTCTPGDAGVCDVRAQTGNEFVSGAPQADPASDYEPGSFSFSTPGPTFSATFFVYATGDTTFEPDERFELDASLFVGGARTRTAEGTATIVNDDPNPFQLSVSSPRVVEGTANTTAVFRLSGTCLPANGQACSVSGSTGNDAAGGTPQAEPGVDYDSRFFSVNVGSTFAVDVPVVVRGDTAFEPDEQFRFLASLSAGGARYATASGTATIVNDDPDPATPSRITADSGSGQSAPAGTAFGAPLVARVLSPGGAGVGGAPVTFGVESGSATFAGGARSVTVTTGSDGRASAALTAGPTPGPVTVRATVPGVATPATFTATVTAPPGPPRADLTAALGAPASAAAGTTFPVTLTVTDRGPSAATQVVSRISLPAGMRVVDAGGGAVSGSGRDVGFLRPSLAAGQSVTYRITVTTDRALRGAQTVTGATATSQVPDPNVADNVARRVVTVTAP